MSDIISPLGGISSPFGQSRFNPASLFATAGSRGLFYDFSDYSTQFTDTSGTSRITGAGQSLARVNDKSGLGNHATQGTAGSQPLTVIRPLSVERRNFAIGSGDVGGSLLWISPASSNGITVTRIASGIDADGLPYNDWTVTGTASATSTVPIIFGAPARVAATTGQQFTCSARVQVIAGTAPSAGNGFRPSIDGETAPTTFVEFGGGTPIAPTSETLASTTYTLANALSNQARGTASIVTASGLTVNYTVRIKALQFELGSTRTTYQRVITANEWYQDGLQSYRGIQTDGVDDFMQTAAIDFAGAESLGSERITNGTFDVNTTGWTPSTATLSVVSGAIRVLSTVSGVSARLAQQTISGLTIGQRYKVTCQAVTSGGSGSKTARLEIRSSNGTVSVALGNTVSNPATPTNLELTFTATETTQNVWLRWDGDASTDTTSYVDFDNVSFKEVLVPADKVTVIAGVRKLSDAALAALVEVGVGGTNGTAGLGAPGSAGATYRFLSQGTIGNAALSATSFPAPDTAVLAGIGDISGDSVILRRNGVQVAQNTADQGTGNYSNAPVYLFRRAGTSLPANVICTFMMVINRVLTASEIAQIEAYANARTGAF